MVEPRVSGWRPPGRPAAQTALRCPQAPAPAPPGTPGPARGPCTQQSCRPRSAPASRVGGAVWRHSARRHSAALLVCRGAQGSWQHYPAHLHQQLTCSRPARVVHATQHLQLSPLDIHLPEHQGTVCACVTAGIALVQRCPMARPPLARAYLEEVDPVQLLAPHTLGQCRHGALHPAAGSWAGVSRQTQSRRERIRLRLLRASPAGALKAHVCRMLAHQGGHGIALHSPLLLRCRGAVARHGWVKCEGQAAGAGVQAAAVHRHLRSVVICKPCQL